MKVLIGFAFLIDGSDLLETRGTHWVLTYILLIAYGLMLGQRIQIVGFRRCFIVAYVFFFCFREYIWDGWSV